MKHHVYFKRGLNEQIHFFLVWLFFMKVLPFYSMCFIMVKIKTALLFYEILYLDNHDEKKNLFDRMRHIVLYIKSLF